jgi:hypothetical protein
MKRLLVLFISFVFYCCSGENYSNNSEESSSKTDYLKNNNIDTNFLHIKSTVLDLSILNKITSSQIDKIKKEFNKIENEDFTNNTFQLCGNKIINEKNIYKNNKENKSYLFSKLDSDHDSSQDYFVYNGLLIPIGEERYEDEDYQYVTFFFNNKKQLKKIQVSNYGATERKNQYYYFYDDINLPFFYYCEYKRYNYISWEIEEEYQHREYFHTKNFNSDTLLVLKSLENNTQKNNSSTLQMLQEMIYPLIEISNDLEIDKIKNLKKTLQTNNYSYLQGSPWADKSLEAISKYFLYDENENFSKKNNIHFVNQNIFFLHPFIFSDMIPSWGEGEIIKRKNYLDQYLNFSDSKISIYGNKVYSNYQSGGFISYEFLGYIHEGDDSFAIDSDYDFEQTSENNNTFGVYLVIENTGGSLSKALVVLIHFTDVNDVIFESGGENELLKQLKDSLYKYPYNEYEKRIDNSSVSRYIDLKGLLHVKNIRDNEIRIISNCRVCRDEKVREKLENDTLLNNYTKYFLESMDINYCDACNNKWFNFYSNYENEGSISTFIKYGQEKILIEDLIDNEIWSNDFKINK